MTLIKRLSKEDHAPLMKKRQTNKMIKITKIRMILRTAPWLGVLDGGSQPQLFTHFMLTLKLLFYLNSM